MNYLFLVPISLMLALIALFAFLWALNSEQYEDLDGAAERILIDEDTPVAAQTTPSDNVKN